MTGPTDDEIVALIRRALIEVAPHRATQFEQVSLASKLDGLELDSIAIVEMIGFVEDAVGRTFQHREIVAVRSVQDIAELIRKESGDGTT
jgi:acyl carrier protein